MGMLGCVAWAESETVSTIPHTEGKRALIVLGRGQKFSLANLSEVS